MVEQNDLVTKNKGKGVTIVIILLILVILSLICYICYDKGIIFGKRDPDLVTCVVPGNDEQNKNEDESVAFSDSELEKYVNYITPLNLGPSPLLYDVNTVSSKSLSAVDKIQYIGSYVYSKHISVSDYKYDIISENNVKSAVEEVYGPNSYQKATVNLGCGDYKLNESEKNYYARTGCGGSSSTSVSNVILGYKATKSKLEITTSYVFFDAMKNKIYKDYNKSVPLDDYVVGNTESIEQYLRKYIKNNKDKLSTIIYTFESSDGRNYYFTGFKNNK